METAEGVDLDELTGTRVRVTSSVEAVATVVALDPGSRAVIVVYV
jgi:hypothetical protein